MEANPAFREPCFVGRAPEMAALEAAMAATGEGRGAALLVVGEAGIGKTSTVEEYVRRSRWPAGRVLYGRSPEQEGAPAFWPWVQVLRHWARTVDDARLREEAGPDAARLGQLVPELATRIPGLTPPPQADAEQSRFLLFDAVAGVLRRSAAHEPLLLVLEDLHWADESSVLLFLFVAGEMRGTRYSVIGTCRGAASWRAPQLFADAARATRQLDLAGLSPTDVERFVAGPNTTPPSPILVDALHEATGGNPFFLREVVQVLRREGRLDAASLDVSSLRLSDGMRAFIRRHLQPLSPAERRVLVTAAAIGRDFDVVLLGAASAEEPAGVLKLLAVSRALALVEPVDSHGRFRFVHALIRETLYGDVSPADRAELHLAIAQALERRHHDSSEMPIAEIAHHYHQAAPLGYADAAVAWSVRAGERAQAQLGYEDAVEHFERALAALALRAPDDRERLRLELALGGAALRAADAVKARRSFENALRVARAVGDATSFARAAHGIGGTRVDASTADPALVVALEDALAMLGPEPSTLRASILSRLATALQFTGEEERREELSREAIAMASEVGDAPTLATALLTRHLLLSGRAAFAERERLADEALALAAGVRHEGLVLESRGCRLTNLIESGDIPAAELELARYQRGAGAARFPHHRRVGAVVGATLAIIAGRFAEAERLAGEARAITDRRADTLREHIYWGQRLQIARAIGGLEEVVTAIEDLARSHVDEPIWRVGLAVADFELGRRDRARARFVELVDDDFAAVPRNLYFPPGMAECAMLAAAFGEPARAAAVYENLLPFAGRNVVIGRPPVAALGAADRYLGMAAAASGREPIAIRHLEDAIVLNTRMGARPQLARTQADLAALLLRPGAVHDPSRARGLLEEARRIAGELGMAALLGRIEALAAADVADASEAVKPAPLLEPFAVVLRKEGDFWTIAHGGRSVRVRDSKGLALLHRLLGSPGREFHALDLDSGGDESRVAAGDAGEMLDVEARAAYRERARELREELAEAESFNDSGRVSRITEELEFLGEELARSVGLGGRSRRAASAVERARVNVARSLGRVLRKIAAVHPVVGQHLNATVRTGTFCAYAPDPRIPVSWEL